VLRKNWSKEGTCGGESGASEEMGPNSRGGAGAAPAGEVRHLKHQKKTQAILRHASTTAHRRYSRMCRRISQAWPTKKEKRAPPLLGKRGWGARQKGQTQKRLSGRCPDTPPGVQTSIEKGTARQDKGGAGLRPRDR